MKWFAFAVFMWYIGLPILVAAIAIPWFMNRFNDKGWTYNALCCIGFRKRLEKRRLAEWQRERAAWENRRYWEERYDDEYNLLDRLSRRGHLTRR